MIVLAFVGVATVLIVGLALLIHLVVTRKQITPPGPRLDGLGDDLRLGIGLNNFGS